MKIIRMLGKKNACCLIFTLLLSACHISEFKPRIEGSMSASYATLNYIDPTKSLFPIEDYPQSVDKWLPPDSDRADVPLINTVTQKRYFSALKSHLFGMGSKDRSPWNPHYIAPILSKEAISIRNASIDKFLGKDSIFWGENFRIHSTRWKEEVRNNAYTDIDDIYRSSGRNIVIRETLIRGLPTDDPTYDNPRQAGQGYPFDNLQISSIRPGTPIYVLAASSDKRWQYIVSPTVTGWVHSEDIAMVDQKFVTKWVSLTRRNLGAIIKEQVSIQQRGQYYFTARPGTVLPFKNKYPGHIEVAVPVGSSDGIAEIRWVKLTDDEFVAMPWKMTQGNIATLLKSMSGRPYGWGNYNFYNDCSAEIRSLLMPFGIFLPRNSKEQILATSKVVDLSRENVNTRIHYLKERGKPFTTLVYIPGHIMLYIGNAAIDNQMVPMTYQNIWGLHPEVSKSRSIIGGSVFFPLLRSYSENIELMSLADKAQFKLGFIE